MNKGTSPSITITMLNTLTNTDVPFETNEANGLLGTNEENFSLKKRGLRVMIKGFSILQPRHLT